MFWVFDAKRLAEALDELLNGRLFYERAQGKGKISVNRSPELTAAKRLGVDCSGFVRYVVHYASQGQINLTGGSMSQLDKVTQQGFTVYQPGEIAAQQARVDETLRIGFKDTEFGTGPGGGKVKTQVGHVWLVLNGHTYESASSAGGPNHRPPNRAHRSPDNLAMLGYVPGWTDLTMNGLVLGHNSATAMLE